LSGAIPAQLGGLRSLQELYLESNQLSGPMPLSLEDLSQLFVFYFDSATCEPLDGTFERWLDGIATKSQPGYCEGLWLPLTVR